MENSGVKSVRPQIIVNGSFESFYFEINGIWLAYPDPITNQELIIDCSNYDSTLDGLNVVNRLNGDVDHFLTLSPGNNNIRMRGVSLSCTVKIGFRPTYY
jgi:phage-related protein